MDWINEILKAVVPEDQFEDVSKKINEAFPKHAVPKDKYNQLSEKATNLESQLGESSKTITSMTEQVKGNEELKKSFDDLKATHDSEIEGYQSKLGNIAKKSLVEKGLRGAKALEENIDLLMNDFKLDDLKVSEDGKSIVDFESALKSIQEKRPSSFPKIENDSNGGGGGNNDGDTDIDENAIRKSMGLPPL